MSNFLAIFLAGFRSRSFDRLLKIAAVQPMGVGLSDSQKMMSGPSPSPERRLGHGLDRRRMQSLDDGDHETRNFKRRGGITAELGRKDRGPQRNRDAFNRAEILSRALAPVGRAAAINNELTLARSQLSVL